MTPSPLLLLRPSLIPHLSSVLPPETVVTSRFMVLVVHYLNNFNLFTLVVLDGYRVSWSHPRAVHPNLLRGLLNITNAVSPRSRFILFFDKPLDDFQFKSSNLIVVPRKLNPENLFEELSPILNRRSS